MAKIIVWSKRADIKFDAIIEYLRQEWGESVVFAFVKKTFDFLDILAEFPEIGTVENKQRDIRGFVLTSQIIIFYKIKEDTIIVLNFFDTRHHHKKKLK